MQKKLELNAIQQSANRGYFRLCMAGLLPDKVVEMYCNQYPDCDIEESISYANKIFKNAAEKSESIVIGECILKLQHAHAIAMRDDDARSQIEAVTMIAKLALKYKNERRKNNKEKAKKDKFSLPPWER